MATMRQKIAFKEVVNGSTISGAMIKAGYSETTSQRTNKLTRTVGWNELLEKHLPDSILAKKHRELLNKRDSIVVDGKIIDKGPETMAVSKALDMGYKLKDRYSNEENKGNKVLIINISGQSNERYGINRSTSEDSTRPTQI